MELESLIKNIILQETENVEAPFVYRTPVVGFADAKDEMYRHLTEIIGNPQLLPTDLLKEAKTVVVFFIPYPEKLGKMIQKEKDIWIFKEWSSYYLRTNKLLSDIAKRLIKELDQIGIIAAGEPPTDNYNPVNLTAKWGHKSSAVIAGIGTFGLNHLLITKSGTMGRLNSLVIDGYVKPTERTNKPQCLYYKNGSCKICVSRCPSGALTEKGIDKFRCNAYLTGKNVHFTGQGCPACSSGPCALKGFAD